MAKVPVFFSGFLDFLVCFICKNLKGEDDEEFFVLVSALRSAGRRRKHARIQWFVEETNVCQRHFFGPRKATFFQ